MPKISVIMPTYNAETYVREAIESILNQTFADFEFLILDGGSKDKTIEIIESYNDDRIKIYKNCGTIPQSLNKGIKEATGEYIARMDADDISLPNRLKKQLNVLQKNKDIAILGTKAQILHNNHLIDNFFNAAFYNKKPKIFDIGIIDTLNTCVLCHPTVMFKKSLIYKHKLYYNENIKASEDQELWCKAILIVRICNLNEVLLQYRLHQNNASTVKKQGQNTAYQIKKKLLNKLLPYNSSILKNLAELETETLKIKECINQLGKHKTLDNQSKAPQKKFIFNFFSIIHTPDKSHKVITILGIKLKIKNLVKNNKDI